MFKPSFCRSDFLDVSEKTVIRKKYAGRFPEVKEMDNDRNGKSEESPKEGRI